MEAAEETKKRAALLAVSPICALIPAAVLTLVAILQPWWTTRQNITYYPTNVTSFTVTQRSEISLWGHQGCRLNETWADICSLPPADCVPPPTPPPGYIPPWTPPPREEEAAWREELVTGSPNVRVTTSIEDRPFRCVSGNCGGPGVTTTPPPSNYQAPAYAGEGSVNFGDGQARLGEEVVSSNEDPFRIPATVAPAPGTTMRPTFQPEVGYVNPSVLQTVPPTTSWQPSGPFAGLWAQVGSGSQESELGELYTDKQAGALTGDGNNGRFPGAQLAVQNCPPYEQQYWDPLSPPAGQFICSLYTTCGRMGPILGCLFLAEGLLCINCAALVAVGLGGGGLDVFAAYANVVILPFSLVSLLTALILAGSSGLSPPVHEMVSVGAICAILAVLLVSLALVLACLGIFSHFAITNLLSKAEAAARVAAEHAQASLEATEEYRLQQDAELAKKKPAPLGWRSRKVQPEEIPGLEDAKSSMSKSHTEASMWGGGPVVEFLWSSAPSASSAPSETPRRNSALKMSVLAIADMPTQPEVTTLAEHVSLPVRSVEEAAPSPATEQCMRSFVQSPEGAIYAQRFGQSSVPPSAREAAEWVPKVLRSSGMTYYVNVETGETRWTPPATNPQEAWSGQEASEQAPQWKKKRLKNGTVISVKA